MPQALPKEVTRLLTECSVGDQAAVDRLLPLVYGELRRLAANLMRRERPDHTLQTTALVHEAYLRLVSSNEVRWENRIHFLRVAARVMRCILVDHAKRHQAQKRGSGKQPLVLDEALTVSQQPAPYLLELNDCMESLTELDPRKGRVVELRIFGGLSVEETAEVLEVSSKTVMRDWTLAKAWLYREMSGGETNA